METITVGELISQLSQYEPDKGVYLYYVGFSSRDSYKLTLDSDKSTVSMHDGEVHINFSNI